MIQAWLAGFEDGAEFPNNNATPDQVAASIALLQTGMFNLTPEQLDDALAQLEELNPALPALAVNAGFLTDPGYLDFINNPGSEFEPIYGGWNPALVWPGLLELFGVRDEASEIGQGHLRPGRDIRRLRCLRVRPECVVGRLRSSRTRPRRAVRWI